MATLSSRQIEPTLRQLSDKVDKLENSPTGTIKTHAPIQDAIPSGSWVSTSSVVTLEKGSWIVVGQISFAANATGRRCIRLHHSKVGELVYTRVVSNAATGGNISRIQTVYPLDLELSQTTNITIQTYQDSGSPLTATSYIRAIRIA